MTLTDIQFAAIATVSVSELIALYLIYGIWQQELSTRQKLLRSLFCLVPVLGPPMYLFGFAAPPRKSQSLLNQQSAAGINDAQATQLYLAQDISTTAPPANSNINR